MYIVSFLSLSLMLGLLPISSFHIYSGIYKWEKSQIAMDNAAIVFGRTTRGLFDQLLNRNIELKKLDLLHHGPHACARFPSPAAPFCAKTDAASEVALAALSAKVFLEAQSVWKIARTRAIAEMAKLDINGELEGYAPMLPIVPVRCPICGVSSGWRTTHPYISLNFISKQEPKVVSHLQVYTTRNLGQSASYYKIIGETKPREMKWD